MSFVWSRPGATVLAIVLVLFGATASSAQDQGATLGFHGSGTTNPSKCIWDILSTISNGIRSPSHLTYRGVGSTIGQQEIINDNAMEAPVAFGCGDIPISSADYNKLKDNDVEIMHLPILLGAVSTFHTVPIAKPYQLNLTSCILARIFMGEIPHWDHPSIAELNPNMQADGMPIHVVVRDAGSSSTSSFTEYLHKACKDTFPANMMSEHPDGWKESFSQCSGSSGVTACILEKDGSIGYIDSGHGTDAGLDEVALKNRDGIFLSSGEAIANDGLAAAAKGQFPTNPLDDFGGVSLVHRPGPWTWPIVQMSYLYVRRNITYVGSPSEQSLLVAFLDSFLNPDVVDVCAEEYGFTIPLKDTQDVMRNGIDMLKEGLPSDALPWTWETSSTAFVGADEYTISTKRTDIDAVLIEDLQVLVEEMQASIDFLQTNVRELNVILERSGLVTGLVGDEVTEDSAAAGFEYTENFNMFAKNQAVNAKAALVLSSLAFILSILAVVMLLFRKSHKPHIVTSSALEQPQTIGA